MFYQSFLSVGAFGAFLALKLSRSQRLWQGADAVHSQHLSLHVDGARAVYSCQRRVLSIVSECWRVWRVPSTKAFAFSTIVAVKD